MRTFVKLMVFVLALPVLLVVAKILWMLLLAATVSAL